MSSADGADAGAAAAAAAAAAEAGRRALPITVGMVEDAISSLRADIQQEVASLQSQILGVRTDAGAAVTTQNAASQKLEDDVNLSLAKTRSFLEGVVLDARSKFQQQQEAMEELHSKAAARWEAHQTAIDALTSNTIAETQLIKTKTEEGLLEVVGKVTALEGTLQQKLQRLQQQPDQQQQPPNNNHCSRRRQV